MCCNEFMSKPCVVMSLACVCDSVVRLSMPEPCVVANGFRSQCCGLYFSYMVTLVVVSPLRGLNTIVLGGLEVVCGLVHRKYNVSPRAYLCET